MARSPWRDALDGKLQILRELGSDASQRSIRLYVKNGLDAVSAPVSDVVLARCARQYQINMIAMAREAEPFYWSHDMVNEVIRRMPKFDAKRHVTVETDLPVDTGIFWFTSPIQVTSRPNPIIRDGQIESLFVRAIMFATAQKGEFSPSVGIAPRGQVALAVTSLIDPVLTFKGDPYKERVRPGLVPFLHQPISPGRVFQEYVNQIGREFADDDNAHAHNIWAPLFLWTAFDMMQRRVFRWGGSGLEREARRQAQRAGIGSTVQIVEWRKAQYKYPSNHIPALIDWSCQWSVRPHTRRLKSGKVVTVRAYVKGPEGRPFKQPRERAHVVKR